MQSFQLMQSQIESGFVSNRDFQHYPADAFPSIHPIHWLHSHFAVGGWSPLQRLSGMLTAHMTRIAPHNGFTWHPHRALEIYTWVLEGDLYHEDSTGGKGIIHAGEFQRMFAGDYIEHQELNVSDDSTRVIQIWFIADRRAQGLQPHYQQLEHGQLPVRKLGDASVFSLIGDDSPMDQHVAARLTAATLSVNGTTTLEAPRSGESLFMYVNDGVGQVEQGGDTYNVGQYDVILATPDAEPAVVTSISGAPLHWLSFYLPEFLS